MEPVLVYRIGSLGDTLVSVPALRATRAAFPGARITLLCDRQVGQSYVLASDLLKDSGLVDDVILYPIDHSWRGRLLRPVAMAGLFINLRRRRFGALVYLAPSNRPPESIARDRRFFGAAGIPRLIGFRGFPVWPEARPAEGFGAVAHEIDNLLARLGAEGLEVPARGDADPRLPASERARASFDAWRAGLADDGGRRWISIGPGAKQPANLWPIERYEEVVRALVSRYDVWPVVFGGPHDLEDARRIVAACGRGHIGAGALAPPAAIHAMARCALHVGNDTGTMHMAAAAGIRCVGIYSSRNLPGLWWPYGRGHRVLRTPIECENCELQACVDRGMACILAITPARAIAACGEILGDALS